MKKKQAKQNGLGFLNLVNDADKETEKEQEKVKEKNTKDSKSNQPSNKANENKNQTDKSKENNPKQQITKDQPNKNNPKQNEKENKNKKTPTTTTTEPQLKPEKQKTKTDQSQQPQQPKDGNIMLTELVDSEQIEQYNLHEYAQTEMNIDKLEKILDDIHRKQRLKQKNTKKAEQYINQKTELIESQLMNGSLLINEETEQIELNKKNREEQEKQNNMERLQLRLKEYNQKRHEMEGQMNELDVEMQYLQNQSQLQMDDKKQKNGLSVQEKERLRQKVLALESKRKRIQKRREDQYQEFIDKIRKEKQDMKQQKIEQRENDLLQKQENAQKGIEKINERAKERTEVLNKFKKNELKLGKSLLDEHKEKLKKVRDMRGQRVSIQEIKEHGQKQQKLDKQYQEQRNKKIEEIKELKKLPVYESHFYKEKQNEYIDELYMEERKQKWKRDKLQQLASEIKQKHGPQVDEKKREQFRLMTDVEEVQKRHKRRMKITKDKKTNEIVDQHYVIPQNIDPEKYQSELYKRGRQNLDYVKQMKKRRKETESEMSLEREQKSEQQQQIMKTIRSEKVIATNYMMDSRVKNKMAYSCRMDEIIEIKDQSKRYELMLQEMDRMDQQVQRQEKVSKSISSAQYHANYKGRLQKIDYSEQKQSQQVVEDIYVKNIKAKLNFMAKG